MWNVTSKDEDFKEFVVLGNGHYDEKTNLTEFLESVPELLDYDRSMMFSSMTSRVLVHKLSNDYVVVFSDFIDSRMGNAMINAMVRMPHMLIPMDSFAENFKLLLDSLRVVSLSGDDTLFVRLFYKLHRDNSNIVCYPPGSTLCDTVDRSLSFITYARVDNGFMLFDSNIDKSAYTEEYYTTILDLAYDVREKFMEDRVVLAINSSEDPSLMVSVPINEDLRLIDVCGSSVDGFERVTSFFVHKGTNFMPYLFQMVYSSLMGIPIQRVVSYGQYTMGDYRISTNSIRDYMSLVEFLMTYSSPSDNKTVGILDTVEGLEIMLPITEDVEVDITKFKVNYKLPPRETKVTMKEFLTEYIPLFISR